MTGAQCQGQTYPEQYQVALALLLPRSVSLPVHLAKAHVEEHLLVGIRQGGGGHIDVPISPSPREVAFGGTRRGIAGSRHDGAHTKNEE